MIVDIRMQYYDGLRYMFRFQFRANRWNIVKYVLFNTPPFYKYINT